MRIDFNVGQRSVQRGGGARGETARERCLAGARRTDKEDDAVHRQVNLLQSRAGGKVQHGLGEKPVFEPRGKNDGVPDAIELRVGQGPDVVDALLVGWAAPETSANGGNAIHSLHALPALCGRLVTLIPLIEPPK
jgi:hypothetical protein